MTSPLNLTLDLRSPDETANCASLLAQALRPGDVVLLKGPVGAGKSHFSRAAIRAVTHDLQDVPSPTFTLVQDYAGAHGPIWHMDLYRLGDPGELVELGVEDALSDAICLIEWPDRLGELLPNRHVVITLEPDARDEDRRLMTVTITGPRWEDVLSVLEKLDVT